MKYREAAFLTIDSDFEYQCDHPRCDRPSPQGYIFMWCTNFLPDKFYIFNLKYHYLKIIFLSKYLNSNKILIGENHEICATQAETGW